MKISINDTFIHAGENNSRTLNITVDTSVVSGKTVRLAFLTPGGKTYISPVLNISSGSCTYLLPYTLLDRYGKLYAQINVTDTVGYCLKSEIFDFEVQPCIDEQSTEAQSGGLVTLSQVDIRLTAAEQFIAGLQAVSVSELSTILI